MAKPLFCYMYCLRRECKLNLCLIKGGFEVEKEGLLHVHIETVVLVVDVEDYFKIYG